MRFFIASGRSSYAACWLANSVSPPTFGTTREYSVVARAGTCRYE